MIKVGNNGEKMRKYYWAVGVYLACVFISAEIYAFVYDVEPSTHCIDEYLQEVSDADKPISIDEWMQKQDEKFEAALDWVIDGCDCALNPWHTEGN